MSEGSVFIAGGRWLDTHTGEITKRDLFVEGGVIVSDGDRPTSRTIDASGSIGMFGLWDCHAHLGGLMYDADASGYFEEASTRTIRAGFNIAEAAQMGITGIRSTGEADNIDIAWGRAHEKGRPVGPRILGTGTPLRTTGGHGTAYPRQSVRLEAELVVDGPDQVARAVRRQVARGAHWIKASLTGGLYSEHETVDGGQFSVEEIEALLRTANQRGVPVAAHCGGSEEAIRFARLGGRSVEHGYALNEEAASEMAKAGTWLVPTIGVTNDSEFIAADGWPPHAADRAAASAGRHAEALRTCLAAGVRVAVGADLNQVGPRLHREMELLESVGMSRLKVLHAASVGGREMNGFGGTSLPEHGAIADLVFTEMSPLENPKTLTNPTVVMAFGRILKGKLA